MRKCVKRDRRASASPPPHTARQAIIRAPAAVLDGRRAGGPSSGPAQRSSTNSCAAVSSLFQPVLHLERPTRVPTASQQHECAQQRKSARKCPISASTSNGPSVPKQCPSSAAVPQQSSNSTERQSRPPGCSLALDGKPWDVRATGRGLRHGTCPGPSHPRFLHDRLNVNPPPTRDAGPAAWAHAGAERWAHVAVIHLFVPGSGTGPHAGMPVGNKRSLAPVRVPPPPPSSDMMAMPTRSMRCSSPAPALLSLPLALLCLSASEAKSARAFRRLLHSQGHLLMCAEGPALHRSRKALPSAGPRRTQAEASSRSICALQRGATCQPRSRWRPTTTSHRVEQSVDPPYRVAQPGNSARRPAANPPAHLHSGFGFLSAM